MERARALGAAVTAALAVALLISHQSAAFQFAFDRIFAVGWACLAAAVVIAASIALGALIVRGASVDTLTSAERLLLRFACGTALLSCFVLIAGSFTLNSLIFWLAAMTPVLVALVFFVRSKADAAASRAQPPYVSSDFIIPVIITGTVGVLLIAALAPPLLYDVTEYHLGALKEYLSNGRIGPMPHNFYARFPFPIEALYLFGLVLEWPRDNAPKLINLAFTLTNSALVAVWLARVGVPRVWRWTGALLFLAHPLVLEVSLDAYIDAGVTFWTTSALYALLLFSGNLSDETRVASPRLLIIGALLTGAAIVSKYTVMQLYLLPLALVVLPPVLRRVRRERLGRVFGIAVLAGAVLPLVWLGKNVIFYGNPLEPFFVKWFNGDDVAGIAREEFYIASHYPQSFLSVSYWQTLIPRLARPELWLLAPLVGLPLVMRKAANVRLLLFCVIATLLWNLVRESQARFLMPVVLILCVIAAQILAALPTAAWRKLSATLILIVAVSHVLFHGFRVANAGEFQHFFDFYPSAPSTSEAYAEGPRAQFLERNLGALGDVVNYANSSLPPESKILLVYEARPYLFRAQTVYNTVFDESVLLNIAGDADSPEEITLALRKAGITHVLVNEEELRRFIQQYARPGQLAKLQVRDVMRDFQRIDNPEDLYPPFYRNRQWHVQRESVLQFLESLKRQPEISRGTPEAPVFISRL